MKIRNRASGLILAFAAASVVTLGLTGTLAYLKHREGELGGCLIAFLAPFALAGVGLALLGLRELLGLLRYGTWELECADGGGVAGEPFPVHIRPGKPLEPTGPVKLTLRVVESTTQRFRGTGGTDTRMDSRVLASRQSTVATGPQLGPRTPFAATLELPAGLPASTDPRAGDRAILWQLVVEVPGRRGDAHVTFELPVRARG